MAKKKKGGTSKGKQQSDNLKKAKRIHYRSGDGGLISEKTANTLRNDSIK